MRKLRHINHKIISIEAEKASAKVEYVFMTKVLKKLERAHLKIRKALYDKTKTNSSRWEKSIFPKNREEKECFLPSLIFSMSLRFSWNIKMRKI